MLQKIKKVAGILYIPASLQQTKAGKYCYSNRYVRSVSHCNGDVNDNKQYGYFRVDNQQQQSDDDRYTHYFFINANTKEDLLSYDATAVICIPDDITEDVYTLSHTEALKEMSATPRQPQASEQPSV